MLNITTTNVYIFGRKYDDSTGCLMQSSFTALARAELVDFRGRKNIANMDHGRQYDDDGYK